MAAAVEPAVTRPAAVPPALALRVWRAPDVLAASAAIAVLATTVPLALGQALADGPAGMVLRPGVAWLLAGAALVAALLLVALREALIARLVARHEHQTGLAQVDALADAPGDGWNRRRRLTRLFDALGLQRLRPWPVPAALAAVPDLLTGLLAALALGFVLGSAVLWVLIAGAVLVVALAALITAADRARRRESQAQERLAALSAEILAGIATVKAMAAEDQMMRRAERLAAAAAATAARRLTWAEALAGLAACGPWCVVAVAAAVAVPGLARADLDTGALAAALGLAWLVGRAVAVPGVVWETLADALTGDRRALVDLDAGAGPGSRLRPAIGGELTLKQVSLRFDDATPAVLDGVSLTIEPGRMIAIGGDSGCGKSSILALFLGTATPSAGEVLIDGRPLAAYDRSHLLRQIGWVAQDPALLAGSLLDNLTLFRRGAVQDRALWLAGQMGLLDVIHSLPDGLDTLVGATVGEALPDGVRQRIAIVRALAGQPPIVLFDDAGSALDLDGDRRLKGVLSDLKGRATVVLNTHRPSLMALADRRFRLAEGRLLRLAEDGDTIAGDPG